MRRTVVNYTFHITLVLAWVAGVALVWPVSAQNPMTVFFGTTPASVNSGNKDAGTMRMVLATDQPSLSNALTVTVGSALPAGTNAIGKLSANSGVDIGDVDVTSIAAGNNNIGDVDVASIAAGTNLIGDVKVRAATANGTTPCYVAAGASTNATNCKASAGLVYVYELTNTTSTIYYLRMYNSSGSPTCSSSTGYVRSIPIPHATGAGGGIVVSNPVGETFGTGVSFCITGGASSTDNTNAATGVFVTLQYN
jgi:hypothetical protein